MLEAFLNSLVQYALGPERVKQSIIRLIFGGKSENYEDGILGANTKSLKERRENGARLLQANVEEGKEN